MTSRFGRALAKADIVLDAYLGEQIMVRPMQTGDFARVPDTARATWTCVALVAEEEPASQQLPSLKTRAVYEQFRVEIRRDLLGDNVIKPGDAIDLLDRPGVPRVRTQTPLRDDMSRMIWICGPEAT